MYIPLIPFPNFIDIFRSLFNRNRFSLNKSFLSKNKPAYQYYARGSEALACISLSVAGKNAIVFIPSFFCNESLNDLRNSSAKLVFYKTNIDMTPDWRYVEELCEKQSPDLFVLTHYFGSINDVSGAIKLRTKYGCELIHDCAHHLLPDDEIVNSPGFILFSPHKLLPVPPLSVVLCDKNEVKKLIKTKNVLFKKSELIWLLKRIIQKYLSFFIFFKPSQTTPPISGEIVKREWKVSAVSMLSLQLFNAAWYKIAKIQKARVENYSDLNKVLSQQSNAQVHTLNLNNVTNPYSYVFVVSPSIKQNEMYQHMRACEVPINTWPDLPPEVIENSKTFKKSIELRKTILLLPVHQDIKIKHRKYIGNILLQELSGI